MKKYSLLLRLRACWRILTARVAWVCYLPDAARPGQAYRVSWQGVALTDLANLRDWCQRTEREAQATDRALDEVLNLNPQIRRADD